MTFMPYRFYTINTRAFLDNEIGEYFGEEGVNEWFRGKPPKNATNLRLRDLAPVEEWLCESPDQFPEWQFSRERVWGSINAMIYDTSIPGATHLFSSTSGYDEINFFLNPGHARGTREKSLAPADLMEYWCGGEGKKDRWTSAHVLPPRKIAWFMSTLETTRDNVDGRLPFARNDLEREEIMELKADLDVALDVLKGISKKDDFDWLLVIC